MLSSAIGKSFTMCGFGEYLGINYRALLKLFEILELRQKTAIPTGAEPGSPSPLSFSVELAVLSVCREQVFDLLSGTVCLMWRSRRGTALLLRKYRVTGLSVVLPCLQGM